MHANHHCPAPPTLVPPVQLAPTTHKPCGGVERRNEHLIAFAFRIGAHCL